MNEQEQTDYKYLAFHDAMTGCKNRKALEEVAQKGDISKLTAISVTVCDLGKINASLGHRYGDLVLQAVGETLQSVYKHVYRLGGDEFLVLLEGARGEILTRMETEVRRRLALCEAEHANVLPMQVTFGYAYGTSGKNLYALMDEADGAYVNAQAEKQEEKPKADGEKENAIATSEHVLETAHVAYSWDVYEKSRKRRQNAMRLRKSIGVLVSLCLLCAMLVLWQ